MSDGADIAITFAVYFAVVLVAALLLGSFAVPRLWPALTIGRRDFRPVRGSQRVLPGHRATRKRPATAPLVKRTLSKTLTIRTTPWRNPYSAEAWA